MASELIETICAPATSAGTGAISVIRMSGPDTFGILDSVVSFSGGKASDAAGYTLKMGRFGEIDDVIVGVYRSPKSYTGEDCAEICCHASTYIVSEILSALTAAGCRLALAGEFTRRAFANGKMDLAQAEAVADVIAAGSEAQHRVAMTQLRGGYSRELRELRAEILDLTALMELELDFSEEDVEFADRGRLRNLLGTAVSHCRRLADSFRVGNAIRNGVPVAIAGAPNSGKSTLLNALLNDDRAIVSDIPGTTRDTVEETCNVGGILLRFIDTAGIRSASDEVERLGIERTFKKMSQASLVLGVVDASGSDSPAATARGLGEGVLAATADIVSRVDLSAQRLIIVVNKMDLGPSADLYEAVREYVDGINASGEAAGREAVSVIGISARTGLGMDALSGMIVRMAVASGLGCGSEGNAVLVTNARHAAALSSAASALTRASAALDDGTPTDLVSEHLREAVSLLGTITGEITTDETLGKIFEKFCIGK